jgi:hypothetical protein
VLCWLAAALFSYESRTFSAEFWELKFEQPEHFLPLSIVALCISIQLYRGSDKNQE